MRARERFLIALANTCQIAAAARAAKKSRQWAYNLRAKDPSFAAAWDSALEIAVGALEDVAIERAVKGVLEPVYQGGVKVGTVRRYSDSLLILLLRANKAEKYCERTQAQVTTVSGISDRLQRFRERAVNHEVDTLRARAREPP